MGGWARPKPCGVILEDLLIVLHLTQKTHTHTERERTSERVFPRWEKNNPAIYVIKKRKIEFTNSFEIGEQKSCFQPNNQDPFDHSLSCPTPPAMITNASSRIKYENQGP